MDGAGTNWLKVGRGADNTFILQLLLINKLILFLLYLLFAILIEELIVFLLHDFKKNINKGTNCVASPDI